MAESAVSMVVLPPRAINHMERDLRKHIEEKEINPTSPKLTTLMARRSINTTIMYMRRPPTTKEYEIP